MSLYMKGGWLGWLYPDLKLRRGSGAGRKTVE